MSNLKSLRKFTAFLYDIQTQSDVYLPQNQNPFAARRRAYALSIFGIIMAEATESDDYLYAYQRLFPRLLLPLKNLKSFVPDAFTKSIAENFIIGLNRYTIKLPKEIFFRANFWDMLLGHFFHFDFDLLHLIPELSARDINDTNINQLIDAVAIYLPYETIEYDSLPLFLMEASNEPLKKQFSHKDESKIAILMTSSLLKLLSVCRKAEKEFLAGRRIFGLLIGATDVEVCVVFPVFDDVEQKDWGDDFRSHVTIIFQNSHEFWRQSFISSKSESNSNKKDGEDRNICDGTECVILEPSKDKVDFFLKNGIDFAKKTESELDENDMKRIGMKILETEMSLPLPSESESLLESISTSEQTHKITLASTPSNSENWNCIALVKFVSDEVKKQATELNQKFPENQFEKFDKKFDFTKEQVQIMGPSKTNSLRGTPGNKRTGKKAKNDNDSRDLKPKRIKPLIFSDEDEKDDEEENSVDFQNFSKSFESSNSKLIEKKKMNRTTRSDTKVMSNIEDDYSVIVTKNVNDYELKIYQNQIISTSPFFPKLFNYEIDQDKKLISLSLEKVKNVHSYTIDLDEGIVRNSSKVTLILSKLFLDLFGAIRTLHVAGYVHSDVSINNVGFNFSTGVWQIYDFDQSLPIEDSMKTERKSGTDGFISSFSEETGIFDAYNDYISAIKTCFFIADNFNCFKRNYHLPSFAPFSKILSFEGDNTLSSFKKFNIDKLYLDAFKIYSNLFFECSDKDRTVDISYILSKSICNEIKGEEIDPRRRKHV